MTAKLAVGGALLIGFFAGLCGSQLARWSSAPTPAGHVVARPAMRLPPPIASATTDNPANRAQALAEDANTKEWREFVRNWSERDPAAAWTHVWATRDPLWLREHPDILFPIFDEWLKRDPAGAREALRAVPAKFLPAETARRSHRWSTGDPFSRLLVHLARVDPEAAFEIAQEHSGFLVNQTAGFLGELAKESPERAAGLAEKLKTDEARDNAVDLVAQTWVRSDPSAALEWAQKELGRRRYRLLLDSSLKRLADRAPEELAPALGDLPLGRHRTEWSERIARTWAQRDLATCLIWARSIDSEVERDAALRAIAERLVEHNTAQAIELTRELSSPTQQRIVVFQAVKQWAQKDRPAAVAFVHGLADENTKADCLKVLQPPTQPVPASSSPSPELKAPSLFDEPLPPATHVGFGHSGQAKINDRISRHCYVFRVKGHFNAQLPWHSSNCHAIHGLSIDPIVTNHVIMVGHLNPGMNAPTAPSARFL